MLKTKGLHSFFPTFVWSAVRPGSLHKTLLKEAYLMRERDTAGQAWSQKNYVSGYTSYSSITDLPLRSSQYAELKKWIDGEVRKFSKALEFDLQGGRLEMSTCWLNIMGKNAHHSFHIHPLSAISGTFYLQTPRGSGALTLEDPRMDCFMGSPPRIMRARLENMRHVHLVPKPGQLFLFESWMRHEVPANRSNDDRVSVSFNYDWTRVNG